MKSLEIKKTFLLFVFIFTFICCQANAGIDDDSSQNISNSEFETEDTIQNQNDNDIEYQNDSLRIQREREEYKAQKIARIQQAYKEKRLLAKKEAKKQERLQMLRDLRGVASPEVYDSLEKTVTENPIKGYNDIEETEISTVEIQQPEQQPQRENQSQEIETPQEIEISQNKQNNISIKPIIQKEEPTPVINTSKIHAKSYLMPIKDITMENLIGVSSNQIKMTLIEPTKTENSNYTDISVYKNNSCKASIYYYKKETIYIDIEIYNSEIANSDACIQTFAK
jgi:hypothetical protein